MRTTDLKNSTIVIRFNEFCVSISILCEILFSSFKLDTN
jgi:hypothetical protein